MSINTVKTHLHDESLVRDAVNLVHLLVDNSCDEEIIIVLVVEKDVIKSLHIMLTLTIVKSEKKRTFCTA